MTDITRADAQPSAIVQAEGAGEGEGEGKTVRRVPGQPDMWVLVLFEALVFTAYFAVYLVHRTADSALFLASQAKLNPWLGTLDTLLLLTSSLFMLWCVQAARAGAYRSALSSASITGLLGVAFLASKVTEWILLIHGGHTISSNEFFTYYFFLTAIHFLHLLIGFVVIGVLVYQLRGPARRSQELVETCAVYWHTVDLLWVLIFSLLYVVR
jgi:nitric oxide reductase NorE protein